MATSAVSNSSNSTNFVMALGTGSGVDIQALATNLVNAEKQPKAEIIQKAIDKNQSRITGYEVVARAVAQVKDALDALAQPATFATFTSSSSQAAAVSITGSLGASSGTHEVSVVQLAKGQRSVGTASGSPPLSPLRLGVAPVVGQASIGIKVGPIQPGIVPDPRTSLTVTASDTKPESIVQAINNQGWPIKASLVQLTGAAGGEVRIVLSGPTGLANQFEAVISDKDGNALVSFNTQQAAQDAEVEVNGVPGITRSTNTIEGVIPGVTLSLSAETGATPAVVSLQRDSAPAKEKIKQLVSNYNDLQAIIDAAQDPNSTVEKLGGSLVGDNTIRSIRDRIRSILIPAEGSSAGTVTVNGVTSSFPASGSTSLSSIRDLGVMIDVDGKMKFSSIKAFDPLNPNAQLVKIDDESMLDGKLSASFDEVAAMFQGKDGKPGIASDMADLVSGNGRYMDTSFTPSSPTKLIAATQRNARGYVQSDKERMAALEDRMKTLLDRYLKQFAIMDSLVGQSKSAQTGVENSFKAMSGSKG